MNKPWIEWLAWGLLIIIAGVSVYLEVKRF
jgi:hypothetical protein